MRISTLPFAAVFTVFLTPKRPEYLDSFSIHQ
jgi:hypothetical protein